MSRTTFNLLGPQGSGKGTQALTIIEHFDLTHFDLGENLRKIRLSETELGEEIAGYMDHGKRVPHHLIADVTKQLLETAPKGKDILFDGLLRAMDELEDQKETFDSLDLSLPVIIFLNLDEDAAIKRLGNRRICSGCSSRYSVIHDQEELKACLRCGGHLAIRHDDTPEAIAQRLEWYHDETLPVVEYFRQHGKVIDIDASPAKEEVSKEVIEKITAYYTSIGKTPPLKN